MLGGLTIAGAATVAVGLPIGGVLVNAWGWRTTFFVNVPFAVLTLAMALFWIPRDTPVTGSRTVRQVATRLDVAGIVGFGGAMTALLVFLMGLRADHPFFDVRLLASNLALTRTYLPMSAVSAVLILPLSRRNLVRMPLVVAALYTQVTAGQIGTASGLFRTFGYLGSIASSAIISIVFHTSVTDHGLHVIALIMVVVSALGLVIVVADRKLMSQARVRRGPSAASGAHPLPGADDRPTERETLWHSPPSTLSPRSS